LLRDCAPKAIGNAAFRDRFAGEQSSRIGQTLSHLGIQL
jgi:hypothetical protein